MMPEVTIERRFRPFIEDQAPIVWPAPMRRLLAHPGAQKNLCEVMSAADEETEARDPRRSKDLRSEIVLAVGPEGGWVPFEVELLEAHGFHAFTAGPRVLRVDTAVPFLLGQLALLRHSSR